MTDLLAARSQMAMSLAFHILFAVVGMAMPLLMCIAEWRWLRTGEEIYLTLARRWSVGTAILFAVGAVSGTVLSFELGLLWPGFMAFAGPIIGMPFSLEGFAFFLEAIFLGIYLYGWKRVSPRLHLFSGVMVLISGTLSGAFVVCANAWMNTPTGYTLEAGRLVDVDPFVAMFNPAAFAQVLHMVLAAFLAVGFVVSAVHAYQLIREPHSLFHRRAFLIAFPVAAIMSILQPMSGDVAAKMVAERQPVKLVAMESHFHTEKGAALRIGGWPDPDTRTVAYDLELPYLLSVLAFGDPHAEVKGLSDFPRDLWPPVVVVHVAFQVMVGCGMLMMAVGLIGAGLAWRRREALFHPRFLWAVVVCGPLGFIAIEAGWVVTEVGRQPWIIQGVMRTAEAVTPMPGLVVPFTVFTGLYLVLGWVVVALLRRQVFVLGPNMDEPSDLEGRPPNGRGGRPAKGGQG